MGEICIKLFFLFATLYRVRGGILKLLFKILIKFCHWLSKICKKKNDFLSTLFQKTQMCFNELDYVMVHAVMNITTANGTIMAPKNATVMVLTYYYLEFVSKGFLQRHNDKCCCLAKLLCTNVCYFILLNQCLTIFCFQKLCVVGKIFIRWNEKHHQAIGKAEMWRMPTVNQLF